MGESRQLPTSRIRKILVFNFQLKFIYEFGAPYSLKCPEEIIT